jgi:hypothetical protein
MRKNGWTNEELEFLERYYAKQGKMFCANALGRTEAAVRGKAAQLGLKKDVESDFFKDWQERARLAKVGRKRPNQAIVMKRLHDEGKLLKTEKQKQDISIRQKKWIEENGHPRGALGMKHSDETKKIISQKSVLNQFLMTEEEKHQKVLKMMKTKEANGNMITERPKTTWKSGWREIGGYKKYYRSRWEANYARFLEFLKGQNLVKDWKHEPKTFWFEGVKRGTVSYLPDFWVEDVNGDISFHEVKGWMDDRSKTKLKRMAKYYPDVKLIVVSSKEYKALEKQVGHIIKDWE